MSRKKANEVIRLAHEAYGSDARASAVADFFELVVLAGAEPSEEEILDRLRDDDIIINPEKFTGGYTQLAGMESMQNSDIEDDGEDDQEPREHDPYRDSLSRVLELLEERSNVLDDLYPFAFRGTRLTARDRESEKVQPYLALLAMTTAHAHSLAESARARRAFEDAVATVLRSRGVPATNFGTGNREAGGGGFEGACQRASEAIGIPINPNGFIRRTFAKDENIDTIGHLLPWDDGRKGRWTVVGQATLERSDGWEKKIAEPRLRAWRGFLEEHVDPLAFLAIPHHIEPLHLEYLQSQNNRLVLDRLRLARFGKISSEARELIGSVLSTRVEYE